MEALALENNLIKQRTPKYNILLRDDKNYPYLQLTTSEAFPRVLVARSVEKGGDFYAGPFLPAKLARRTMALSHRLFGIRSCNEVITGQRGAAVPRVRHQALHRAVRRGDLLARSSTAWRWPTRRLLLEGRNDELIDDAARPHGGRRPRPSGSRRRRSCATRMRTVQTLRDRQQKVATRAARRSRRVRPEGRAERRRHPGVRDARRPRRRARGAGDRPGRRRRRRRRRAAGGGRSSSTSVRVPPAEINLPLEIEDARGDGGVAVGARRPAGARSSCRSAATSARWSSWPRATPSCRTARGSTRSPPRTSTRSRRCAPCSACRRCRAASSASTSRRSRAARPWRRWSSAKTGG